VPTASESQSPFPESNLEDKGSHPVEEKGEHLVKESNPGGTIMTKLKGRWVAGLGGAALLVALAVFPVFADEGHGKMGHGGHDQEDQEDHSGHYLKHLLKHAKEIGLTPEQVSKVKAIQLDFKRSEARLEADVKIAKLDLQALMEDEKADLNAIQAKVEQLKKAEAACQFAAIKSKRTATALLTPDQREKDRAVHEQMKSAGDGQHGGGMGGTMGGRGGMGGGMMGGMGGGGSHGGGQSGDSHQSGMGGGGHESGGSSGSQQHQH
jgi:protein CpxP